MKNNLENSFKNQLKDFEVPYDDKAWESFSKVLDNRFPVKENSIKSARFIKIGVAASIATIFGVSTYLIVDQPENTEIRKTEKISENIKNKTSYTTILEKSVPENLSQNTTYEKELSSLGTEKKQGESSFTNNDEKEVNNNTTSDIPVVTNKTDANKNDFRNTVERFVIPEIANVCSGEIVRIYNPNKENLLIVSPKGKRFEIKGQTTFSLKFDEEGQYSVGKSNSESFIKDGTFKVFELPNAEFSTNDANLYNDKGLPSYKVAAIENNATSYQWLVNQKNVSDKKNADLHLFEKGNYTISLTVKNQYGCKSTKNELVKINMDYDLIAMNALDLSSTDTKKNTFIPYALHKRDSKFTMYIYDQQGREIYKTSDADSGWNGINQLTNEMVEPNSVYVWKVILENPEPNEKNVYKGVVNVVK